MFVEIANNLVDGARVLSELLHTYDYQKLAARCIRSSRLSTAATT